MAAGLSTSFMAHLTRHTSVLRCYLQIETSTVGSLVADSEMQGGCGEP